MVVFLLQVDNHIKTFSFNLVKDQFLLFYSNHSQGVLRSTHRQLLVGFRTTFV
ncbi:hypothetical protein LF25067_01184 [Limosilactobacillus fermentum]|nr:hypothetical protein LF25067_01184 [Limosilactobacillus fermentum]